LWHTPDSQNIRLRSRGCLTDRAKGKSFQVGDIVLLWDKKNEKPSDHNKFDSLWLGPYRIDVAVGLTPFSLPTWMVIMRGCQSMGSV
jgi:hypothetical protein